MFAFFSKFGGTSKPLERRSSSRVVSNASSAESTSLRKYSSELAAFGNSNDESFWVQLHKAIVASENSLPKLLDTALGNYLHGENYDMEPLAIFAGTINFVREKNEKRITIVPNSVAGWNASVPNILKNEKGPEFIFGVLDILERLVCVLPEGIEKCAQSGFPPKLMIILRDALIFKEYDDTLKPDDATAQADKEETDTESDDDVMTPKDSSGNRNSGLSRGTSILDRLAALVCRLLPNEHIQKLIAEHDSADALVDMLMNTGGVARAMFESLSSQKIDLALVNFLSSRRFVKKLTVYMKEILASNQPNKHDTAVRIFQLLVKFLQAGSEETHKLMNELNAIGGYKFAYELVLEFRSEPCLELFLSAIRDLLYIRCGRSLDEEVLEHENPVYLARNDKAFAVMCLIICRSQYSFLRRDAPVCGLILEQMKMLYGYINFSGDSESWDPENFAVDPDFETVVIGEDNTASLSQKLLNSVMTVYSCNPSNFGLLDEKFGLMSTLLKSLGWIETIEDEVIFMIFKLLELISVGLEYRPVLLIQILCNETLPSIVSNRKDSIEIVQGRLDRRAISFCLNDNANMRSDSGDKFMTFPYLMDLICQQVTKMISIDDLYIELLINAGFLKVCLVPFIDQASRADPKTDPEMFEMLPQWCFLLGAMLQGNYELVESSINDSNLSSTLHILLPRSPKSVLHVIGKMCLHDDNPNVTQEISAMLELLQQNRDLELREAILDMLMQIMQRSHALKDGFRYLGGFESLLAVMVSLQAEEDHARVVGIVRLICKTYTIALSGSHEQNRRYLHDEIGYAAISSTFELLGLFNAPYDKELVDMVLRSITESVDCSTDFVNRRIVNLDPFTVLELRIEMLSDNALEYLLNRLYEFISDRSWERAANCEMLTSHHTRRHLIRHLGERLLLGEGSPLKEAYINVIGALGRYHATTQFVTELLELSVKDGIATSAQPAVLDIWNRCTNYPPDDAFACSYIQMSGPSDIFVIAPPDTAGKNHNNPRVLNKNQGSHRSIVEPNAPGSVHIPNLGKRNWPPASGYTLSMWVWLEHHAEDEILLVSMRTSDGYQYLRCTVLPSGVICIRSCGNSTSNAFGQTSGIVSSVSEYRASAFAAVISAAEASAKLSKMLRPGGVYASHGGGSHKDKLISDTAQYEVRFSGAALTPGKWHHICIVHRTTSSNMGVLLVDKSSSGRVSLYCDGRLVEEEKKLPYPGSVNQGGLKSSMFFGVDPIVTATRTSSKVRRWRLGTFSLLDVPQTRSYARAMFLMGVNYVGCLTRSSAIFKDPRCLATVILQRMSDLSEDSQVSVSSLLSEMGAVCESWKEVLKFSTSFLRQGSFVDRQNVVFAFYAGRRITLLGFDTVVDAKVLSDRHIKQVEVPRAVLINTTESENHQSILAVIGGGSIAIQPLLLPEAVRSIGGEFVFLRYLEMSSDNAKSVLELIRGMLVYNEHNTVLFREKHGQRALAWLVHKLHSDGSLDDTILRCMWNLCIAGTNKSALLVDPEMLNHVILNSQIYRNRLSGKFHWRNIIFTYRWLTSLIDEENRNRKLNFDALHRLGVGDWMLQNMVELVVDKPSDSDLLKEVVSSAMEFLACLTRGYWMKRTLYEIFRFILISLPFDASVDENVNIFSESADSDSNKTIANQLMATRQRTPQIDQEDSSRVEIFGTLRVMLIRIVEDLINDSSIPDGERQAHRERILMTYADILSAHWFLCTLAPNVDRVTWHSGFRLLTQLMDHSNDFAHHFLSSGAMEKLSQSMLLCDDVYQFLLTNMLLIFGIPLELLSNPVARRISEDESIVLEFTSTEEQFIGPDAKKRLMRRHSSLEDTSTTNVATNILLQYKRVLNAIEKMSPKQWHIPVLECMVRLCVRCLTQESTLKDKSDPVLQLVAMFSLTTEAFPGARNVLSSKSFVHQLALLVFAENENDFTGPISNAVLGFFASLVCASLADTNKGTEPKRLLETLFQAYPPEASLESILSFQTALAQSLLPSLSLLVDDATCNAKGIGMSLPYNADVPKLIALICYLTGRASFGWVPRFEHTVLELIVQTKSCSLAGKYKSRITRCIRGLVLWSLDITMTNQNADMNGQLLKAISRNFANLDIREMKILPSKKIVHDSSGSAGNPYTIPQSMLPNKLNLPLDSSDEPTVFVICFLALLLRQAEKMRDNQEILESIAELMVHFREIPETKSLCTLSTISDVFDLVAADVDTRISDLRAWMKSNEQLLSNTYEWMWAIWQRTKHLELFGSPQQCGLTSHALLKTTDVPADQPLFLYRAEIKLVQDRRRARMTPSKIEEATKDMQALLTSTHRDAVDRHRRWNREALTSLIRGKRFWDTQAARLKIASCKVFMEPGDEFGQRWQLDFSESTDRMRRMIVTHDSFSKKFHLIHDVESLSSPKKSPRDRVASTDEGERENLEMKMNEMLKTIRHQIGSTTRVNRSHTNVTDDWISEECLTWEQDGDNSNPSAMMEMLPEGDDEEADEDDKDEGDIEREVSKRNLAIVDDEDGRPRGDSDLTAFSKLENTEKFAPGSVSGKQKTTEGRSRALLNTLSIEEEMAELGWANEERLYTEIELHHDNKPIRILNCSSLYGLDERQGICLCCPESIYFVNKYRYSRTDGFEKIVKSLENRYNVTIQNNRIVVLSQYKDTLEINTDVDGAMHASILACDYQNLPYNDIREIYRRRHMFRDVGLEIFLIDGRNIFLIFDSVQDRDFVFSNTMRQNLPNSVIRVSEASSDPIAALVAPFRKYRDNSTRQWIDGEISNFDYLMHLNYLAGRSYNDLTQYPVFPWVLRQFTQEELDLGDPQTYRDLSKPMGALCPSRAAQFVERYNALESQHSSDFQPFHYGTHYSCSAYVLQFLIRLEPFTALALQLQGGHFDRPDRHFSSIQGCWRSASGEDFNAQDVRELIPEFFYLPEFLTNSNHFDLGETQRGVRVDDVTLPPWSRGDPFRFVRLHRKALESRYVSEQLHEWIDLIFGCKQRGRAAIDAVNVFHPLTYEDEVDLDSIDDPFVKNATIAQIHNFGQTPRKLFSKPHPKKKIPKLRHSVGVTQNDIMPLMWHAKRAPPLVVPGAYRRPDPVMDPFSTTSMRPGDVALYRLDAGNIKYVGQQGGAVSDISFRGDRITASTGNTTILSQFNIAYMAWGCEDGSVEVHTVTQPTLTYGNPIDKVVAVYEELHHGPLSVCAAVDETSLLWTGGPDALVNVWKLDKQRDSWTLQRVDSLVVHAGRITCIATCKSLGIAVSGCVNSMVVVWDLVKRRLIRHLDGQFKGEIKHISINQVNGNIFIHSDDGISVWHVNGTKLGSFESLEIYKDVEMGPVTALLATPCEMYQDGIVLVTGHELGFVTLWDINYANEPGLIFEKRKIIRMDHPVAVTALATDAIARKLAAGDMTGRVVAWSSIESHIVNSKSSDFVRSVR